MDGDLPNKVVAITGGADGIGYEIADKFLQKGAKTIIILDINEKLGTEAVKKLNVNYGNNKAVFLKCDVTTDIAIVSKKFFDSYKVDVLVNNAGIVNDGAIRKTIDTNVTGVIECGLTFWEHMRKDKGGNGGTIINIASIYGYRVDQFLPVYQASKFAVMGFTKSLGHVANFERSGVKVVAICPGFTETKSASQLTIWDMSLYNEFQKFLKAQSWQKVDAVGNAAVEIYQKAKSGSTWLIEGGKPIAEINK